MIHTATCQVSTTNAGDGRCGRSPHVRTATTRDDCTRSRVTTCMRVELKKNRSAFDGGMMRIRNTNGPKYTNAKRNWFEHIHFKLFTDQSSIPREMIHIKVGENIKKTNYIHELYDHILFNRTNCKIFDKSIM